MKIKIRNFKRVLKIVQDSAKFKRENISNDPYSQGGFAYGTWAYLNAELHPKVSDVVEHPCGTASCLGGWGCILTVYDAKPNAKANSQATDEVVYDAAHAKKFYGITEQEADHLFYGGWHAAATLAPDEDVIAKLKNIIRTGKVINPHFDRKYA